MISSIADFQPSDFCLPPFKDWNTSSNLWNVLIFDKIHCWIKTLDLSIMKAPKTYLSINPSQYWGLEHYWGKLWQDITAGVQVGALLTQFCPGVGLCGRRIELLENIVWNTRGRRIHGRVFFQVTCAHFISVTHNPLFCMCLLKAFKFQLFGKKWHFES